MMGWYGGWGAGQWIWMVLGMLVFWGVVIALIVALLRWAGPGRSEHVHADAGMQGPGHPAPSAGRALQILDERFASGELTEEEYQARRAVLQGR